MNTTAQSPAEMREAIASAKPGSKLKVVFADQTSDDLKGNLYLIIAMCLPDRKVLELGEMAMLALKGVADSGNWEDCHDYTFTVLEDFDPNYFVQRTINQELLKSVAVEN